MKIKLEKEIPELEAQLDDSKAEHAKALKKLEDRLERMNGNLDAAKAKFTKGQAESADGATATKDELASMEADVSDMDAQMGDARASLKDLREALSIRMMDMAYCGCKAGKKASLLKQPDVDYETLFDVEKLERERNDLSKAIQNEQSQYGTSQSIFLGKIDALELKMKMKASSRQKDVVSSEAKAKALERQKRLTGKLVDSKRKQLERVKADQASTQEKYDELETAMGKCGCGPKAF